jgi:hypothetical protein
LERKNTEKQIDDVFGEIGLDLEEEKQFGLQLQ